MKNHLTYSFDYSLLDVATSDFLYEKENILIGIQSRYSREVGKVFFEAQQKLSNKGNGTFEKWYSSIGFKKQNVNNYINIYKNVQSLDEPSAEIFDSLPKSLQNEMSKPSSNQELNQKVFDGDITTHKQYKELEKQLKEKDKQIENLSEVITNQEPKVIEKKVEVIPDDYQELKSKVSNADYYKEQNETLKTEVKQLEESYRELLSERSAVDEQSDKYKQLSEAINHAEGQLGESQKLISDYKKISDLLTKSNEFLSVASSLVYQDLSEVISRDGLAKRELNFLIERLEMFLNDLTKINKNEILEGEIINE